MKKRAPNREIIVRALRTTQGSGIDVFAFFLFGSDVTRVADISRVERDEGDELKGFQRSEVKSHVKSIVDYLNSDKVLFPNAIILALGNEVEFRQSRGPIPKGMVEVAQSGNLTIPVLPEGRRVAWIVDGQQRSLALAKSKNNQIPVPVIAFISPDIETQREQFILVNKAKPLPTRLINELLPEVDVLLPRDLASRKLPSELCNVLNRDPNSPFHKLIRRESVSNNQQGVVVDSAILDSIREIFGHQWEPSVNTRAQLRLTQRRCTKRSWSIGLLFAKHSRMLGVERPVPVDLCIPLESRQWAPSWIR